MNAKRCKKIRKLLAKTGLEKVELKVVYTRLSSTFGQRVPTTFKYPRGSFQRTYKDIKHNKGEQFR
jgi:hypothetical protein